jgi:hypothetical protein
MVEVCSTRTSKYFTSVFLKRVFLEDLLWLRKITTDPHILAHVAYTENVLMIGTQNKNKNYIWELFLLY